jgi:predicted secreted acid phosphatase
MMKNLTIFLFSICTLLLVGCQNNQPTEIQKDKPSKIKRANLQLLMATAWYQQSAEMDACYYQAFYQEATGYHNIVHFLFDIEE